MYLPYSLSKKKCYKGLLIDFYKTPSLLRYYKIRYL